MHKLKLCLWLTLTVVTIMVTKTEPAAAAQAAQATIPNALDFLSGSGATNPPVACTSLFDLDLSVAKTNNPGKPILWTYGINFRDYITTTNGLATQIKPCLRIYLVDPLLGSTATPFWGDQPLPVDGGGLVTEPCQVMKGEFPSSIHITQTVTITESSHLWRTQLPASAAQFAGNHLKCELQLAQWINQRKAEIDEYISELVQNPPGGTIIADLDRIGSALKDFDATAYDNFSLIAVASDLAQNLPAVNGTMGIYPLLHTETIALTLEEVHDALPIRFPVQCLQLSPPGNNSTLPPVPHHFDGRPVQYLWYNHRMKVEDVRVRFTDYVRRAVGEPFQTCIAEFEYEYNLFWGLNLSLGTQNLSPLVFPLTGAIYLGYDPATMSALHGTVYELIVDPTDSQPPPAR